MTTSSQPQQRRLSTNQIIDDRRRDIDGLMRLANSVRRLDETRRCRDLSVTSIYKSIISVRPQLLVHSMHELPKDLTKSLRSWRGSVVRDDRDIEKQEEDEEYYGKEQPDSRLRATVSDLVLHPTKSTQALNQNYPEIQRQQWNREDQNIRSQGSAAPNSQLYSQPVQSRNTVSTGQSPVEARRQTTFNTQASTTKKSIFDQPKVSDPDGAASRLDDDMTPLTLQEFYELMGMRPSPDPNALLPAYPKKYAVPGGLYSRIRESYDHLRLRYKAYDILTYVLMVLQLLLSAVFIILGSLGNVDSHIAIAVLGALSTVIAGSLALMKGQGLPNRLRQGCDGLHYVLFEAEELYWDIGSGRDILYKDVKKVREDYLRVLEEQRTNHPDTWNSISSGIAAGVRPSKGSAPMSKSLVSFGHK